MKIPLYDDNNNLLYTYVPDFYIPLNDTYIEIKGKFEDTAKEKIKLFKSKGYKLILIDAKQYNIMYKMFRNRIPLWEDRDQNIKNCPNLYKKIDNKYKVLPKDKKCPVCGKPVNKLNLHFTKQLGDLKHKELYDNQVNIIKNLFYDLNFNKHCNTEDFGVIFSYDKCLNIWNKTFGNRECKLRSNKLLKLNNERKNYE